VTKRGKGSVRGRQVVRNREGPEEGGGNTTDLKRHGKNTGRRRSKSQVPPRAKAPKIQLTTSHGTSGT